MRSNTLRSMVIFAVLSGGMAGCVSPPEELNEQVTAPRIVEAWSALTTRKELRTDSPMWSIQQLGFADLSLLIDEALANNQPLKIQYFALQSAQEQVGIAHSRRWPSIDLMQNNTRAKSTSPDNYRSTASLDLQATFELDWWGKLSDAEQQANYQLLSQTANFENMQQQLIANVISSYVTLLQNQSLHTLFERRVTASEQNLDTIEFGYRQGINSALDVYLARNELSSEIARLASQKALLTQSQTALEVLLGRLPTASIILQGELQTTRFAAPTTVPSDVLRNHPQVRAAWYSLLAANAGLAVVHKQRFPSINLTASLADSGERIDELLSSSLGWSLIGRLSAPIFTAGRLASQQQQASLVVKQAEQTYLNQLYTVLSQVENRLIQESTLIERVNAQREAEKNALIAESLSFEQYQRGLTTFITVLDARQRAFDAQSSLIQLQQQLISNRANLQLALGVGLQGSFQP